MTENVKTELSRIVSALAGTGIVSKVILFGSCIGGGCCRSVPPRLNRSRYAHFISFLYSQVPASTAVCYKFSPSQLIHIAPQSRLSPSPCVR
jgi:hypothetical protein